MFQRETQKRVIPKNMEKDENNQKKRSIYIGTKTEKYKEKERTPPPR